MTNMYYSLFFYDFFDLGLDNVNETILLSLYKKNLFLLKEIVIIMNPIHECATAVNVH
ncbi:hypothetical protein BACI71_40193 [Bacillus mycoides]|uniref:Uncharacterized protein n=1 Tax=Bacillus mycoides TaxID=1405 RepID=A0A653ZL96_BACMY|nr:hypothetical protein BACI71_40193 [Bacillus mycoides]